MLANFDGQNRTQEIIQSCQTRIPRCASLFPLGITFFPQVVYYLGEIKRKRKRAAFQTSFHESIKHNRVARFRVCPSHFP